MRLPCGIHHSSYRSDHAWWQTNFVRFRMALLFLILAVLPFFIGDYWLSVAHMLIYTILCAMGVQLLIGYTGQITVGHSAFIAVGAYTSAVLVLQYDIPYWLTIPPACLMAGIWSLIFGLPSARVKGFYLIMTTMAAHWIIVDFIITQYVAQIGGRGHSFSLPPGTIAIGPWVIDSPLDNYYLGLLFVIPCFFIMANLIRSRVGRAWMAIRDNDIAAQALGVNIVKYKLLAFFVAGMFGGLAGSYWVGTLYVISPEHFPWVWALWLVGVILIGGVGSLYGIVFGSAFMVIVLELLKLGAMALAPIYPVFFKEFLYFKEMFFGLSIILFLIYEPNGLAYRWWQFKNYIHLWPFRY